MPGETSGRAPHLPTEPNEPGLVIVPSVHIGNLLIMRDIGTSIRILSRKKNTRVVDVQMELDEISSCASTAHPTNSVQKSAHPNSHTWCRLIDHCRIRMLLNYTVKSSSRTANSHITTAASAPMPNRPGNHGIT